MKKEEDIKEKFKQALISTVKAISEDFQNNKDEFMEWLKKVKYAPKKEEAEE